MPAASLPLFCAARYVAGNGLLRLARAKGWRVARASIKPEAGHSAIWLRVVLALRGEFECSARPAIDMEPKPFLGFTTIRR
jgi:hypothetical protein